MQFERDNISAVAGRRQHRPDVAMPTIAEAAKDYVGVDEDGRLADADLRRRITDHLMENRAFQLTMKRAADEAQVVQRARRTPRRS